MTGDGPLRKAARSEGVTVMGTIGVLDRLHESRYINDTEYIECLKRLQQHNGKKVRLPAKELEKRIERIQSRLK
jgi:predicted nucleic acid-binding protein